MSKTQASTRREWYFVQIVIIALLWYGHLHKQLRYAVGGGIVVLVLGWQHAYDLLIVYGALAAFAGLV